MLFIQYTSFLVLVAVAYGVEAKFFRFDYYYDDGAKMWFKLHKARTTWHEARKRCMREGATLASPVSEIVVSALNSDCAIQYYSSKYSGIYVGVHSTYARGEWQSIEGVLLSKLAELEVNLDHSASQCAVLDVNRTSLTGVDCKELHPYVCYKQDFEPQITVCGTVDRDYILDDRTGSCYKFHSKGASWWLAYEMCNAEGAYLAVIDSHIEATVLEDIFARNPNTTIISPHPDVAHIGFVDWQQDREWYTVLGEPLKYLANWEAGEPNNNGNERCGSIFRNARLNDVPCDAKLAFICEKNVDSLKFT